MTVLSTRLSSLRLYGLCRRKSTMSARWRSYTSAAQAVAEYGHRPARLEPAVTCDDYRDEHPLVDPETSEPFRDDHIDVLLRFEVKDVALHHLDDRLDPVRSSQVPARTATDVCSTA